MTAVTLEQPTSAVGNSLLAVQNYKTRRLSRITVGNLVEPSRTGLTVVRIPEQDAPSINRHRHCELCRSIQGILPVSTVRQ